MKTFQSVIFLFCFLSLSLIACDKNADHAGINNDSLAGMDQVQGAAKGAGAAAGTGVLGNVDLSEVTFCSAQKVSFCAGQSINIGDVSVQTAIDGKVYITYTTKANWYIKEIHLYAGADEGIPVNSTGSPVPGQFPYTKTFTAPYNVQVYTWVFEELPLSFTVAAHASVVKIGGNGAILDAQTAWGDGCNGKKIKDDDGNWGTKFSYVGTSCTKLAAATEMVDICSKPVVCFFGIHPVYGCVTPWSAPSVTVGGYTYTEAEGRAIGDAVSATTAPDSKYGYMQVATLKLSNTEYALSPSLDQAVTIIETWLATKGKLSPTNLPTGNAQVRNAASIIDTWINTHNCPERR